MLKKKNIAMAMAAATVVTAAPAYAAPVQRAVVDSGQEQEIKAVKEKVAAAMQVEYTTNKGLMLAQGNSGRKVFTVKVGLSDATGNFIDAATDGTTDEVTCDNYVQFEKEYDALLKDLKEGQFVMVEITAPDGYREMKDGQIVDFQENNKYIASDFANSVGTAGTPGYLKVETLADGSKKAKVQISNENGEERFIDVAVDDVKLDITQPIYRQVDGYYVDANGNAIQKVEDTDLFDTDGTVGKNGVTSTGLTNGVVDGFYPVKTTAEVFAPVKDVVSKGVQKVTINSSEIYNVKENRLTQEGNEIFNALKKAHTSADYTVAQGTDANVLTVTKMENGAPTNVVAEITLKKDSADRNGAAYNFLIGSGSYDLEDTVLGTGTPGKKIETLAGTDRYKTAIEVANARTGYAPGKLVLVSGAGDKLVDGLTATPLANSLNAPLLLTGKDTLPKDVIAYIEANNINDVTIVGSEASVSEEIVKVLKNNYRAKVTRLGGNDRYETSLAVAEAVRDNNGVTGTGGDVTSYVVGGAAEADALSIASIAGSEKAPIILVPKSGLTTDIKYALKNDTAAHIVGGTGSVSEDVAKGLMKLNDGKLAVDRTFGTDRQETNAEVIKKFHTTTQKAQEVVVAKSDNKGMIDALGAGAYAAKTGAPVVLATNELTVSQEDNLNAAIDQTTSNVKIVGYGIAGKVAEFVKTFVK